MRPYRNGAMEQWEKRGELGIAVHFILPVCETANFGMDDCLYHLMPSVLYGAIEVFMLTEKMVPITHNLV